VKSAGARACAHAGPAAAVTGPMPASVAGIRCYALTTRVDIS
jgi:hypothetical protein